MILLLGVLLLFISTLEHFRITKEELVNGNIASLSFVNEFISLPGWFLVALSILILDISSIIDRLSRKIIGDADWSESPDR